MKIFSIHYQVVFLSLSFCVNLTGTSCLESVYIDKDVIDLEVTTSTNDDVFHLFSHGEPGRLLIEGKWMDKEEITDWFKLSGVLSGKSHMNIYGCNFAKGTIGLAAVAHLENALSVSIAASDDLTGIDGDWDLEVGSQLAVAKISNYPHNLQVCNCKEYIYLNEPLAMSTLKFEVTNSVQLTEVPGANGLHWYPGSTTSELQSPHGLAMDINGNVYIAETGGNSSIRRLDCDGNIAPTSEFEIIDAGSHTNMFSIGNTIYVNNEGNPELYNLCTGDNLGAACLNHPSGWIGSWGMSYNATTNTVYVSTGFPSPSIGLFAFTPEDIDNSIATGTCIDPLIVGNASVSSLNPGDMFLENDFNLMGITGDDAGNIYVTGNGSGGVYKVLKFDANGAFITESTFNSPINNPQGIVWSSTQDRIYVASYSDDPSIDCVAVYDAQTLQYLGTAAPNPNTSVNNTAKTLAITMECCVSPSTQIIDQVICGVEVTEPIFLNEIFPCDGVVCGAPWVPADAATAAVYDDCSQSINADVSQGCYSFTKTGSTVQCGAFDLTFNVDILDEFTVSITGDQTLCPNDTATPMTATSSSTTVTYQWQMSTSSCTGPWTDVSAATTASYTPPAPSVTTYYQVIAMEQGSCSTDTCDETSNCVTITPGTDCCPTENCFGIIATKN